MSSPQKRILWISAPFVVVVVLMWWAVTMTDRHREELRALREDRERGSLQDRDVEVAGIPAKDPVPDARIKMTISDQEAEALYDNPSMQFFADLAEKMDAGEVSSLGGAAEVIRHLNDPNAEPAKPAVLATVIPSTMEGWTVRGRKSGTSGLLGMRSSFAEAQLRHETGVSVLVKIIDPGTMQGISGMVQDLSGTAEVEQSNEAGTVRTFQHEGFSGVLKYATARKKTTLVLPVHRRYIVMIEARNAKPELLEKVLLPLLELNRLAPAEPVPAPEPEPVRARPEVSAP
jgi:hypothetical protein